MGEVWRAYDTETNRVVALKVLPADLAQDPMFQQRFRREAHAAAGLNEPHVVPIHHFGEIDGRLFVDMRLIEGRDLAAVLSMGGPLGADRAVVVVEQVGAALTAAHRVGLVHRDVKPSNILLTENDFAYLIDFGIARRASETGLTSVGAAVGTLAYMAPERFRTGQVDPRSDIYALSCVLYESLTGHPPFPGQTMEQLLMAHLTCPPPRPSAVRPGVPTAVDGVIAKGMAKDPGQRYGSAIELGQAARAALATAEWPTMLGGFGSATRRNFSPGQSRPWWRRKAVAIPVAIGLVVISISTALITALTTNGQGQQGTASATGGPVLEGRDLQRVLLTDNEFSSIVGGKPVKETSMFSLGNALRHHANVDNDDCLGALFLAESAVYRKSGWGSMVYGEARTSDANPELHFAQSAVLFVSSDEAKAFFDNSVARSRRCAMAQLVAAPNHFPEGLWALGSVQHDGDSVMSQSSQRQGGSALSCQHAMGFVLNMVAEALVCGDGISDEGHATVRKILDKAAHK